jgi:hypothetical protein
MSSKVTTKKNLIIFHDPEDWYRVLDRLAEDFGQAIRMRFIMKRELGFTARDHRFVILKYYIDHKFNSCYNT